MFEPKVPYRTEREQMTLLYPEFDPICYEQFSEIKAFLYNLEKHGESYFDAQYRVYMLGRIKEEIAIETRYQSDLKARNKENIHPRPKWFNKFVLDFKSGAFDFLKS